MIITGELAKLWSYAVIIIQSQGKCIQHGTNVTSSVPEVLLLMLLVNSAALYIDILERPVPCHAINLN